ncbi:PSD1 and planctomycete cytochrome C domain-containing protein [Pleomorphovibrio marinus]|uniref:PSD1 and planctomycete cytochrome C domain-containing protein n=1 Tax=Pleomorphovibrio marinus TaxID=2164132 RepID=UPI000E09F996|nr:PSD1 and planctomycete cytochrome C domain-containing protein [Pleomorphovibrio marinus]
MLAKKPKLFTYGQKYLVFKLFAFLFLLTFTIPDVVVAQGAGGQEEVFWLWKFLGRLHPLAVHFPVSLLIFAALLELFTLTSFHSKLRPGINLLVLAGAASAIIAAILGLVLANAEDYGGSVLSLHQWTGIGTALLGIMALTALWRISQKETKGGIKVYRSILFVTALGVSVAGHFGASLTHGEEYLTSVLPWNEREPLPEIDITAFQTSSGSMSEEQEVKLVGQVRAVFAHNCYNCHSAAKIKGELRLDGKEHVFKGGESGEVIVPGDTKNSELIRRINLPASHKDAMPSKGKTLGSDEKALIAFWVEQGAPWPEAAESQSVFRVAELAPRNPPLPTSKNGLENPVDLWVNDYFDKNGLDWGDPVDDKTFLRRIYLDVLGVLPSPTDYADFQDDPAPNKREAWVAKLLSRNDDYAMHWLTFWNDALRNDYTGTGYITKGRYAITDWLYTSIRDNKRYDQFVKELLNPGEESKGFIEGIRWRGDVNASQVTEMQAAQNVGQVILGLNLKCASCHDSFISDWKLEEAYAFANIFADTTLEVSRCDKPLGKKAKTKILWEELGEIDSAANRPEKLRQLAENLVQPSNGRMYRTLVNRVWKQLMGRGMVEPVDEMDNEPWSQDLLDWLAYDFVENGYNIKDLIYKIATSKVYQLSSVGYEDPLFLVDEDFEFEGAIRRRLTAEQFSDAISQVIYPVFDEEAIKFDPFELTKQEEGRLEFVRASLVANNDFLKALGRPSREVVSTSRDSQANLLQALELTNGVKLNNALKNGAEKWITQYGDKDILIHESYRQLFGRDPLQREFQVASEVLSETPKVEEVQDLFWALLLTPEFQIIY